MLMSTLMMVPKLLYSEPSQLPWILQRSVVPDTRQLSRMSYQVQGSNGDEGDEGECWMCIWICMEIDVQTGLRVDGR